MAAVKLGSVAVKAGRALNASRVFGKARVGSLLQRLPGIGSKSRLFGDVNGPAGLKATRPGILNGTSKADRWAMGWSAVSPVKKFPRAVFRVKINGIKLDLWHGLWRGKTKTRGKGGGWKEKKRQKKRRFWGEAKKTPRALGGGCRGGPRGNPGGASARSGGGGP